MVNINVKKLKVWNTCYLLSKRLAFRLART